MRKRTIRRLPEIARDLARAHNDAEALARHLLRLIKRVNALEGEHALVKAELRTWEYRAKAAEDQDNTEPSETLFPGGGTCGAVRL